MKRAFSMLFAFGLFCTVMPCPASASQLAEARKQMPTVLADLHYADKHCVGFHVDRDFADALASEVFAPMNLNDEPHQAAYLSRYLVITTAGLSYGVGTICGEIWSLYGPSAKHSSGFATLLPHIRFTPPDTFRQLLNHYRFDMSRYDEAMQSRMRSALGKVFDVCPGLDAYTADISADRIEFVDHGYGYTIDYEGAREPWGRMFRMYFKVSDTAGSLPPQWIGHTFGIYVNNDMSELVPTKAVGNVLCGLDADQHGIDRVIFLK